MKKVIIVICVFLSGSGMLYSQSGVVKDACDNVYETITLGNQVWMAENMRCAKYDTQSKKAGKFLQSATADLEKPYYYDVRTNMQIMQSAYYMSSEEKHKLGILYNWSAALGFDDGEYLDGNNEQYHQGICPNGYHIPTLDDVSELIDFLSNSVESSYLAKHLKSNKGWNLYKGYNTFGMSVLPAGWGSKSSVIKVGYESFIWTATDNQRVNKNKKYDSAYTMCFDEKDKVNISTFAKGNIASVRCVKNIVTDACGNQYPIVKIGEQYWMGENMRCNKYDSESEMVKLHNVSTCDYFLNNVPTEAENAVLGTYSTRLGSFYSAGSALGWVDFEEFKNTYGEFFTDNNRQGICPDGWRIPNVRDVIELREYIASKQMGVSASLRTKMGWVYNGNDVFGFGLLPAGHSYFSSKRFDDGDGGGFYIAGSTRYCAEVEIISDHYMDFATKLIPNYNFSIVGYPVRCIKK